VVVVFFCWNIIIIKSCMDTSMTTSQSRWWHTSELLNIHTIVSAETSTAWKHKYSSSR
jgi:hypothetical protein